jgi:membrane protease YdiL (CAAX protease family)
MSFNLVTDIIYLLIGLGVAYAWFSEYQKRQRNPGPELFWPGTTRAPISGILITVSGILLFTVAETCAEIHFQVSAHQSVGNLHILGATMGAAIVEEMVFRGFVAPSQLRGIKLLGLIIVGSVIFSVIHGFDFSTAQGRISLITTFFISIWLYLGRYNPLNPERSILPCLIGHAVRNLAVFGVKWAQGFVDFNS